MAVPSPHPVARAFFRGLGIVLPPALTLFILVWLWNFLGHVVVGPMDQAVNAIFKQVLQLVSGQSLSSAALQARADEILPPGLRLGVSIVAVVTLVLGAGFWLTGFFGRRMLAAFDRGLLKVPLIAQIYPNIKQITEFLLNREKKVEFEAVVALPYPRKGLYSLAFLTGSSLRSLEASTGEKLVSVFIPSSPMPMTGYTIFVPLGDLIRINLTVDEALRTVISGGVLVPQSEQLGPISIPPVLQAAAPASAADSPEEAP